MSDPLPLRPGWRRIVCPACGGRYIRPAAFVGNGPPCRGCGFWPVETLVQATLMEVR